MKSISVKEYKELIDEGEEHQLIDVREEWEHQFSNIGGVNIPQGQISNNIDEISKDKKVIIYCRSGARSGNIVQLLSSEMDFDNLYNLEGGIIDWAKEIDSNIKTY